MTKTNSNVFDAMGDIWAEIADKNQTQRQLEFLKRNLKPDGYILDFACGTGRHSIFLSELGYQMVGLDVSSRLLRIAKQRSRDVQLVRGDMRFLPFKTEAFISAISMDTSLGYLPSEKEDTESLSEANRVLKQSGVLIVDVFNSAQLVKKYDEKETSPKTYTYPSFILQQKRTVNDKGDWLCDVWSVKNKSDGHVKVFEHKVRLYHAECLCDLLQNVGFKLKATLGDYEGQDFSGDSPRLIVVAAAN
jgi:ubiquinone/menaquinone biosynthesis C-methylase UbiE